MKHVFSIPCILVTLAIISGCGSTPVHRSAARLEPKPYLLHLPGITGGFWMHDQYTRALKSGGFDAEMGIYDWTGSRFSLAILGEREAQPRAGQRVADFLTLKHRAAPISRCMSAARAVGRASSCGRRALPDDVNVEAAVLVSPALSTTYDLSGALRHVRKQMLVFPSKGDGLVLGFGTFVFGTMDRKHEKSAGLDGFTMPPGADAAQYAKLEQHTYRGKFFHDYGNGGGHAWAVPALRQRVARAAADRHRAAPPHRPPRNPRNAPSRWTNEVPRHPRRVVGLVPRRHRGVQSQRSRGGTTRRPPPWRRRLQLHRPAHTSCTCRASAGCGASTRCSPRGSCRAASTPTSKFTTGWVPMKESQRALRPRPPSARGRHRRADDHRQVSRRPAHDDLLVRSQRRHGHRAMGAGATAR